MNNGRKGVTLMEMTIVIAVIGIISTIVVSFTMMVSQRAGVGSGKMDALNEIEMTKAIVEAWVDKVEADSKLTLNIDNGNLFALHVEGGHYQVKISEEDKMLVAPLREDEILQCPAEHITGIKFNVYPANTTVITGDYILFCTLTYEIPKAGLTVSTEEKTLTFCINSHLSGS